jgi:hypothetical protein
MHPIGSQAGTQAIIDARILTQLLASTLNPLDALQHYDLQRRPAMNDIILRNRRFGPEIVMQLVEERAPNGFHRIEDVISNEELETTTKSYSIAAGLDIETVNYRSSFVKQIAERWSHFLRQPAKVDSLMQRTVHHEDAETVFGRVQGQGRA